MHRDVLLEAALRRGHLDGNLDAAPRHRAARLELLPARREEPDRMAVRAPMVAQQGQELWGERHIAVFAPLAVLDMDQHARTVDLGDPQEDRLVEPQASSIDRGQADAVVWAAQAAQETPHFFDTKHGRQRTVLRPAEEVK